jgi:hypothetical protein
MSLSEYFYGPVNIREKLYSSVEKIGAGKWNGQLENKLRKRLKKEEKKLHWHCGSIKK